MATTSTFQIRSRALSADTTRYEAMRGRDVVGAMDVRNEADGPTVSELSLDEGLSLDERTEALRQLMEAARASVQDPDVWQRLAKQLVAMVAVLFGKQAQEILAQPVQRDTAALASRCGTMFGMQAPAQGKTIGKHP